MAAQEVEARVFLLPGGKVQIFIDNGSEDQARTATRAILAQLAASGIAFESIGEIELHRTGGAPHAHVINEVKHEH
jgi:hypothetical protein